jgi:MFS family permease
MSATARVLEIVPADDDVLSPRAWRTLAWTSLAVFMAVLDGTVLFVAFPSIARSFPAVSAANLSWILNAYTIVYGALLVPAGRLADRFGRRRVFLTGVGLFALASLACGLAPSPAFIVAGRIVQAVGGALLTPSSLALVLAAFPRSKRSVAVSIWAAVGAFGAAVGPSLGSAIMQLGGWRWAFFVNLPFALVALTSGRRALEESQSAAVEGMPDVVGIVQLIAGMALVALGVVGARESGAAVAAASIAAGVATLAFFVRRASRVASPALDLSLFAVPSFRYANLATLVYGATFSAMFECRDVCSECHYTGLKPLARTHMHCRDAKNFPHFSLPPHRLAVGSGVNQALRQGGGVLGVGVVVGVAGRAHGAQALPTFQVIFLLLVLGGLATAAISAAIDTRPRSL